MLTKCAEETADRHDVWRSRWSIASVTSRSVTLLSSWLSEQFTAVRRSPRAHI